MVGIVVCGVGIIGVMVGIVGVMVELAEVVVAVRILFKGKLVVVIIRHMVIAMIIVIMIN